MHVYIVFVLYLISLVLCFLLHQEILRHLFTALAPSYLPFLPFFLHSFASDTSKSCSSNKTKFLILLLFKLVIFKEGDTDCITLRPKQHTLAQDGFMHL